MCFALAYWPIVPRGTFMKTIKGNILDIYSREIFFGEVSFDDKIVAIYKIDSKIREDFSYIVPGLIDSHVHVESSMLVPSRFSQMIKRFGTVAIVYDPHEIANVLGSEGVEFMINDAKHSEVKMFLAIPSCVPASSFETNGAKFSSSEISKFANQAVALAEMMNYPGVINDDSTVLSKLEVAKKNNLPIDGHAPLLSGEQLLKYVSSGISTDHEVSTLEEAKEKIKVGMKIIIREGSAARNFDALSSLFFSNPDDIMVCTDDAHPDDIISRGHINRFVLLALSLGVSIFDIYKACLLNPISHYNLNVGTLKVGDAADFLIVNNIESFNVLSTFISGIKVYNYCVDELDGSSSNLSPINNFISRSFLPSDFAIKSTGNSVRVITVSDGELLTGSFNWRHGFPLGSNASASVVDDIAKICVINRYIDAPIAFGFIKGFGIKSGAIASSIAHDSHNVVVVGVDDGSISLSANTIFSIKGGLVVVNENQIQSLSLPIAGLMADEDFRVVSEKYLSLISFAKSSCGVSLNSPFMTMAFMSLLVIPSLKLSDKGLFDVDKFKFTSLFFD